MGADSFDRAFDKFKETSMPQEVYVPHEGQARIHKSNAKIRILRCCRGWGKTVFSVAEALARMGIIRIDGIKPSKRPLQVVIVDRDYKSSQDSWECIEIFTPPGMFKRKNLQTKEVEFVGGHKLYVLTAQNPESVRGKHPDIWVLNEAAQFPPKLWTGIIEPATHTKGKLNKVLFLTTPRGHDWFWETWRKYEIQLLEHKKGERKRKPSVELFHYSVYDAPYVDIDIEETKKTTLPNVWKQEYMAEFLDDRGTLFDLSEAIEKVKMVIPKLGEIYVTGWDYAEFKDWSWLISLDTNGWIRSITRMKNKSPQQQVEIAIAHQKRAPGQIIMDSTGVGRAVFSVALEQEVNIMGFKFTKDSKKQLIAELHMALARGEIKIPDDGTNLDIQLLIQELQAFEYTVNEDRKGDPVEYGAPKGKHDDAVIALALANYLKRYFSKLGSEASMINSKEARIF